MKILILCTKLPYPPIDGGSIATLSMARGLAACGFRVSLLTFNTKKHYFNPADIPSELKAAIDFHFIEIDTSPKVFKAALNLLFSRKAFIASRYKSSDFSLALSALLKKTDFDIVQLEGPYLQQYISLIRKHSTAPVALRAHNVEHEIWERRWKNTTQGIERFYYRNLSKRICRLEKTILKEIDFLVAISERDKSMLQSFNREVKAISIPAGIDLSAYTSRSWKKTMNIGFIGALDWAPNQEGLRWMLKEILPGIRAAGIILHIAGRNAPPDIRELLRQEGIKFHDEVNDAIHYITSFGIMVVPLLSGSGIRIKILEALALERCIITTSIGAEGIPAEDGRHLMIADRADDFAEKIIQAVKDPEMSLSLGQEGRKLIEEKFDTFALASQLGEFYTKKT